MSRVGKKPVAIPTGVTASVEGQTVKVKGPKGAVQLMLHDDVAAKVRFALRPGHHGRIEARSIEDVAGYPAPGRGRSSASR